MQLQLKDQADNNIITKSNVIFHELGINKVFDGGTIKSPNNIQHSNKNIVMNIH